MTEVGGGREPLVSARPAPTRPAPARARARARIDALLDPGSFTELDRLAAVRDEADATVVAGTGAIDGRDVAVYTLDPSRLDEMAARKVAKVQDLALRSRVPIIGIHEPGGRLLEEDVGTLAGRADILHRNVRSSGVVPQLSVILGPCAGEDLYSPALTDVVLVLAGQLAGAPPGLPHLVAEDEAECWQTVRALLAYLPSHNVETPPFRPTADPVDRADPELQALAATGPDSRHDALDVVRRVLDEGRFLEIQPFAGQDVLVGFGRLAGHAVGVVANRPQVAAEPAGLDAATKAARFVRLCDGFNIPLVALVDTPGGAVASGARLLHACADATVPRLTVVIGGARGGAYALASSRQMGADLSLAWPAAEIAATDPYAAAERGFVDAVIEPRDTRRLLIRGLELCLRRTVDRPRRKHGDVPL